MPEYAPRVLRCPRCDEFEDLGATRAIRGSQSFMVRLGDDGEQYLDPVDNDVMSAARYATLHCGSCGHAWRTGRDLPVRMSPAT